MQWWNYLIELVDGIRWAIAGMVGAAISSRFHKDEFKGKIDYAVFVASGAFTAHYCTGAVATYFEFGPDNQGAVGFLLGAFGGSLIQAIIRSIKAADFWTVAKDIIKARFGGGQ